MGAELELSSENAFQPVLYKKAEGILEIGTEELIFRSNNNGSNTTTNNISTTVIVSLSWNRISKHQVSPASHPKALLKVVLLEGAGKPLTFQFSDRPSLERARKSISQRLQHFRSQHNSLASPSSASSPFSSSLSGSKRRHMDALSPTAAATVGKTTATSFGELDPTSLAVTRSSLLAANPTLRAQHQYLVQESQTVEEEDFWKTHQDLLEDEYARIAGITRAGTASLLQSHLSTLTGRITLGVEEMRQIFIMYPAVHKAYEEKVPLELSDEQFWRKYLESEYFHRDRGRIGAASRRNGDASAAAGGNGNRNNNNNSSKADEARAAAVGTDDLFSRYDQKLRESGQLDDGVLRNGNGGGGSAVTGNHSSFNGANESTVIGAGSSNEHARHKKWGTNLAVGQFDLASTFETERGMLLEGPKDNHPVDPDDDGKGAKVIQKYNRHWAMVLNPEDAVAGSNLMEVARKSVKDTIPNDDDAKARGGMDEEMQRLVGFANADSQEANHASGMGESDDYEILQLKNVEVYHSGRGAAQGATTEKEMEEIRKKNRLFASSIASKMKALASKHEQTAASNQRAQLEDAFPPVEMGRDLLAALTKKMAADSKTDADTLEVVNSLPENFKKRLHSYFRRSSELLRHFFGLRKLAETSPTNSAYNVKLQKIVKGMEIVYREMETMRKDQGETGTRGVTMRKMVLQIMDQLDWAFKLHRESSGSGGGGGFVTVEEF